MLTVHWNGHRSVLTLHTAIPHSVSLPLDSLPGQYIAAVAGAAPNDLIVVGTYNRVFHYNGATFREYPQLMGGGFFEGAAVQGRQVCMVGDDGGALSRAIVVRGVKR